MSENKHTEGEWFAVYTNENWEVCENPKYLLDIVTLTDDKWDDGDTLARSARFRSFEEREANAKLIAAAPNLLAACEELLGFVESDYESKNGSFGTATETVLDARKAIAKAKGENL